MSDLKETIKVLTSALTSDDQYRYSWQANIAVQFQDAWQRAVEDGGLPATPDAIHKISNEAAVAFLNLLCWDPK